MRSHLPTVVITSLAFSALAHAGDASHVPLTAHTVSVTSAAQSGARTGARMHVRVDEAQPGSKITLFRQRRSQVAKPTGTLTLEGLHRLSEEATHWEQRMELLVDVASAKRTSHHEVEGGAVMWPNSRYRFEVQTRDGQKIKSAGHVVSGLTDRRYEHYSFETDDNEPVALSGKRLPSARAWAQAENLYVTTPHPDTALIKSGEARLTRAAEQTHLLEKLEADHDALQATIDATESDRRLAEISTLRAEIDTLKEDGAAEIARGKKSTVSVLSLGGLPLGAKVTLVNSRLADEGVGEHTAQGTSHEAHGFLHQVLDAVGLDRLRLTVEFPTEEDRRGSAHRVEFEAPSSDDAPVFSYGGQGYHRIKVVGAAQKNEPDPTPPDPTGAWENR